MSAAPVALQHQMTSGGALPDWAPCGVTARRRRRRRSCCCSSPGSRSALPRRRRGPDRRHLRSTSGSRAVEGTRQAKDRLVTFAIVAAFLLALLPLISLLYTVVSQGHRPLRR